MRIHEDSERPGPMRACAACRTRRPAAELLRFASRGARVVLDPRRRLPGRGLNLCPSQDCLRRAVKRGAFRRGLGVSVDGDALHGEVCLALAAALGDALAGGRRPTQIEAVDAIGQVLPASLRPLVEVGAAPAVRVSDPRLAGRVGLLASAIDEFTFKGPGVMKRPPERDGCTPGTEGRHVSKPPQGLGDDRDGVKQ